MAVFIKVTTCNVARFHTLCLTHWEKNKPWITRLTIILKTETIQITACLKNHPPWFVYSGCVPRLFYMLMHRIHLRILDHSSSASPPSPLWSILAIQKSFNMGYWDWFPGPRQEDVEKRRWGTLHIRKTEETKEQNLQAERKQKNCPDSLRLWSWSDKEQKGRGGLYRLCWLADWLQVRQEMAVEATLTGSDLNMKQTHYYTTDYPVYKIWRVISRFS